MKPIHFISGIPRSGSTMLCNLLAQNPRFHPTSSSGLYDSVINTRNMWGKFQEHKTNREYAKSLIPWLQNAMQVYHKTDREVIFDKGRAWPENVGFLETLLERKTKIIITLRPIDEVLASYEKLFRKSSRTHMPPNQDMEMYYNNNTVAGRCEYLLHRQNIVGRNLERIRELQYRPDLRDRFHFVWYSQLTYEPEKTLRGIYEFIGEEYYQHDFENIPQYTQEDDHLNGHPTMHTIRNIIEVDTTKSEEIIGEILTKRYREMLKLNN